MLVSGLTFTLVADHDAVDLCDLFARAFRKAVGSAPGAYREMLTGRGISPADLLGQRWLRSAEAPFWVALIAADRRNVAGAIVQT